MILGRPRVCYRAILVEGVTGRRFDLEDPGARARGEMRAHDAVGAPLAREIELLRIVATAG